jgi:hypothetical protein
MYRFRLSGSGRPSAGDALFSPRFGADQSCGAILNVVAASADVHEGLAVAQIDSARDGGVHWKSVDGPALEFLPLPSSFPE